MGPGNKCRDDNHYLLAFRGKLEAPKVMPTTRSGTATHVRASLLQLPA